MNRFKITFFLGSIFPFSSLLAQVNTEAYQLSVKRTSENIVIDGKLDEPVWNETDKATDFIQFFPTDSLQATSQTEVSMTFNDQFLYVAGKCYENSDKKHIIQSLKRDFDWPLNENFGIYFDPFNDFINGFSFGITPVGVQREGLITKGEEVAADWDNKWYSAVDDTGAYWSFEFAIPFKSIRYNPENRNWNVNFLRLDLKNNEISSWTLVPQGFKPSLTFAGQINFEDELPKAGVNISFIPFVTSGVSKNYEEGGQEEYNFDAGFDAKVALSSSLNLDLTYNPDFSQVEVDQQVTNVNRFEIFFPEKRQFFLENNDLFGINGLRSSRPFFSRRIGIASNNITINGVEESVSGQVPIQYGARLSGKIGNNWRIGLLNMQTKESEELGLPKQMYSVAVAQRKIFAKSTIGFIAINKNSFDINIADTSKYHYNSSLFKEKDVPLAEDSLYVNNFNTVYGTDINLLSFDNKWSSSIFYHRSISPQGKNNEFASGAVVRYLTRNIQTRVFANAISDEYNAEVGYIRRKDLYLFGTFTNFFFYPDSEKINNHGPTINHFYYTDMDNNLTDYNTKLGYQVQFLNTAKIKIEAENRYERLRRDFDPTRTEDGILLLTGDDFKWNTISAEFNTDRRKVVSFEGKATIGGFYNGERTNVSGQFNYRYQPIATIAFRFDYNKIDLPLPYNSAEFWLLGPRIDLTFTDKLFLTTFVQYNEQADNMNINARFQWRYKPASDLFIVYTDNYFPDGSGVKNRALVMKLNYWLNI